MKINFKQKKITSTAVLLGAALVGAMTSDGLMSVLPVTAQTTLVKGSAALGAGALASAIEGDDMVANAAKGALMGVFLKQGYNVVKSEVGPKVATASNPTGMQKFVNASFGMGAANYSPRGLRSAIMPEMWDATLRAGLNRPSRMAAPEPIVKEEANVLSMMA